MFRPVWPQTDADRAHAAEALGGRAARRGLDEDRRPDAAPGPRGRRPDRRASSRAGAAYAARRLGRRRSGTASPRPPSPSWQRTSRGSAPRPAARRAGASFAATRASRVPQPRPLLRGAAPRRRTTDRSDRRATSTSPTGTASGRCFGTVRRCCSAATSATSSRSARLIAAHGPAAAVAGRGDRAARALRVPLRAPRGPARSTLRPARRRPRAPIVEAPAPAGSSGIVARPRPRRGRAAGDDVRPPHDALPGAGGAGGGASEPRSSSAAACGSVPTASSPTAGHPRGADQRGPASRHATR